MTLRGKGALGVKIAVALTLVAAPALGWSGMSHMADRQALKNTSLTSVREQALTMFPRGSRLEDAAGRLTDIGFDCQAMTHFVPDTSAPSLLCASDGRGYPDFPAVNLTLMTRNGLIADIEVWNVMARADSELDDNIDLTATGTIRSATRPERRILSLPWR